MATVASRSVVSCPQRDAVATWQAIVDLLTQGKPGSARDELLAVTGVAASLIADRYPAEAAITITCEGPRSRIYCLYDEDSVDGSGSNDDPFGFDPLKGDWQVSLPCHADDLPWVETALATKSSRIRARNLDAKVEAAAAQASAALMLDPERFLGL